MAAGHMDENLPGIDSTMGWLSLLRFSLARLLQLCVFRFCSDENGDVWVGVFPQPQKILICCARLGGVALERVCAAKLEMGQRAQRDGPHDARVINNLLEFRGGSAAVPLYEIGLPACVDRIQKPESAQFMGGLTIRSRSIALSGL